mgnify:FL=1
MGRVALCCRSPFFAFWVVGAFFFLLYNVCGFGKNAYICSCKLTVAALWLSQLLCNMLINYIIADF